MQRELCATVGNAEHSVVAERLDDGRWRVVVDDREQVVDAAEVRPGTWSLVIQGRSWLVDLDERKRGLVALVGASRTPLVLEDARRKRLADMARRGGDDDGAEQTVAAPIAGKVVKLLVSVGDQVQEGQGIVVLEAMKMENEIKASRAAKVTAVHVEAGQSVDTQEPLLTLE